MPNIIKPKRSYTASNTPSLAAGELAIQCADKKVLIGNSTGTGSILVASLNLSDMVGTTDNITQGSTNKYYADSLARASISSSATGLTYTSGTGVLSFTAGYSIPTTSSQTNWDSAYSERRQWDGGSTNLVAATARTSLGLVIGTNVQAWDADLDSIAALAGTSGLLKKTAANTWSLDTTAYGSGTVTSIATTSPITGGTITGTGTIGINASSANTASYVVQRDASGNFSAGTITATLTGTASTATNLAGGSGGTIPYQSAAGTTAMLANGTAGQLLQANGGTAAPSWVASPGVPTGSLFPYAGSSAPTGYLLCDGAAVSRSTYATLFGVLSTTYGSGDGSTTFNLPDLRGRLPLGAGTGVGLNASGTGKPSGTNQTARTAGQWLGNETVTLTTSNIPQMTTGNMSQNSSHNHGSGATGFWVYNSAGAGTIAGGSTYNASAGGSSVTASTSVEHTHTVGTASPTATTNIPPSVVVNYIIKT